MYTCLVLGEEEVGYMSGIEEESEGFGGLLEFDM